ncbi:MAG: ribonuclease HII [Myxococcales bacterium]|nr:ribonuclease HII [Myxococcales bacterium]
MPRPPSRSEPAETADLRLPEGDLDAWARQNGARLLVGVDEVGRGPLAGPVVAAAVVLDPDRPVPGLADSKRLSPARREQLDRLIRQCARALGLARVEADTIDRINIRRATLQAMALAVMQVVDTGIEPDLVLVDGRDLVPLSARPALPQRAFVGGDGRSSSIAAASIVAKVYRDGLMTELHRAFPEYGFDRHKGYGTREHLEAIARHGPCPWHRKSFAGVKEHLSGPGRV